MKQFATCLKLVLLLILVCSCASIFAYDFEVDGIKYRGNESTKTASVMGKNQSYIRDIVIPEFVTFQNVSYTVRTISESAFDGNEDITSIVIPPTITFMDEAAFDGCVNLNSVYISNIESWCNIEFDEHDSNPLYYANHLIVNGEEMTDIVIPEGIDALNDWAFYGFAGIYSVTLPSTLIYIDRAFGECINLSLVISNKTTPPFVEDKMWRPFSGISPKAKLIVPKGSISSYYSHPVWGNSFKRISEDLNNITFEDPDVKNICVSYWDTNNDGELSFDEAEAVTDLGNAFTEDRNIGTFRELINFTGLTSIASKTFHDCRNLSFVLIPENVETIYPKAFHRCYALASIDIPSNVKTISADAFDGCTGLTSVNIFNGVETIGSYAFFTCKLNSINIPASVKNIGTLPFPHSIENIEINKNNPFYESPDGSNCIIIKETKSLLFGNNNPTIPSGTLHIGDHAFIGATFVDIYIPKSIETIGKRAFEGCTNLVSISIPKNVKVIEESVFSSCKNLSNIELSNSITSIEKSAFENCISLSSITIPQNVTSIGASAFQSCSALISVFLPHNITSIGNAAFKDCSSLSMVESKIKNPFEIYNVFSGISMESELHVPYGTKNLYEKTTGWNVFWEIIENEPQCFDINIAVVGYGSVICNGKTIRNQNHNIKTVEGSSLLISFYPDSGYRLASVNVNDKDMIGQVVNNKLTIENITADTNIEVTFEAIPVTTYSFSIKSTGEGAVTYEGTAIRKQSKIFTVAEGTTAVVVITPDEGYRIKSVLLNSADVTSQVVNYQYATKVEANTTLEVEFEEDVMEFAIDGLNYHVVSYSDKIIKLANGNYGTTLTVPATCTANDRQWNVIGVEADALRGNPDLAAIIWNPAVAFNGNVSNPNLLLYVKEKKYAGNVKNVIVNGEADEIVLQDAENGNNFYCPQAFIAKSITYEHNYSMKSGYNTCQGWETLVLPFDVTQIRRQGGVELVPHNAWTVGSSQRPFWLYSLTELGWKKESTIAANTPYIICMPNNENYSSKYNISGVVQFIGTNVQVKASDNLNVGMNGNKKLVPNYQNQQADATIYALNVNNQWCQNTSTEVEGSTFISSLRAIRPFEAYLSVTGADAARRAIPIFEEGESTGIIDIPLREDIIDDTWYTIDGRKLFTKPTEKGVYIKDGKKIMVK